MIETKSKEYILYNKEKVRIIYTFSDMMENTKDAEEHNEINIKRRVGMCEDIFTITNGNADVLRGTINTMSDDDAFITQLLDYTFFDMLSRETPIFSTYDPHLFSIPESCF